MTNTIEDLAIKIENLSLAIDMLSLSLSAIQNQHLENALVLHNMSSKVNKMYEWMAATNKFRTSLIEKVSAATSDEAKASSSEAIMEEPETLVLVDKFNELDVVKDKDAVEDVFMKLLNRFPVRTSVPPPIHPLKHYDCPLD